MKEFPYFANYIGKSRFLWYGYYPDNYNKYLGTIYDENGEIINEKFELGVESKFKIGFAKSGQFIVFAEVGNKLVANTYNRDGQKLISDFVVHELNNEKVRDLNFYVNKDKILFAWSGRKLDEGNYDIYAITYNLDLVTGIKESISPAEYSFKLEQNYPNPFNPSTTIKYSIPSIAVIASGAKQSSKIATSSDETWTPRNDNLNITLKIYDILGREVATLVNKEQKHGNYEVQFDASNLTSGIYFYRLQSGGFLESRKMILLK
ncbi:MAG: T9SS type A sorting domain-containing protein [Bacteroidetes bacterium]|nr:T9SS type A sorting domain-containing protein [Bacteroidota bacterium]MBU1116468.1 T9SS type A sorting domain-containing protein [Bacteroidota bacterium]MBU1797297.1 T9SS type A sorting domain-containing protein [Bacteroidota bacterium]